MQLLVQHRAIAIVPLVCIFLLAACTDEAPGLRNESSGTLRTAKDVLTAPYNVMELTNFRASKDQFFKGDKSPILEEERSGFTGLRYFAPSSDYVFDVLLERLEQPEDVEIDATKGDVREMKRLGTVSFTVGETPCILNVYKSGDDAAHLFIPFKDKTTGTLTYEVGRYLDLEEHEGNRYVLDFNYAYNPFCAYNERYACPIVPRENVLPVAINAGEMMPEETESGH